ncbi:hypothetical protein [Rhodococcus opacus]|uniref:hypothetical protein n=1 Tax=Rhodococcus opacus TaxID=37919 RepID=UPI002A5A1D47|nr:hypothetical protein [Rhodococcus opacus]
MNELEVFGSAVALSVRAAQHSHLDVGGPHEIGDAGQALVQCQRLRQVVFAGLEITAEVGVEALRLQSEREGRIVAEFACAMRGSVECPNCLDPVTLHRLQHAQGGVELGYDVFGQIGEREELCHPHAVFSYRKGRRPQKPRRDEARGKVQRLVVLARQRRLQCGSQVGAVLPKPVARTLLLGPGP